jgi:S1-C subfamily serine protease
MLLPIGSVFMRVFYLILSIIVLTVQGCATNPSQTSQQDGTSKPIGDLISFDTPFSGDSSSTDKETKKSTSSFNFGKLLSGNNDSSEDVKYGLFYDQGDHLKELVEAGKFDEANSLFSKYKTEFFESESAFTGKQHIEKYYSELEQVAAFLNSTIYKAKLNKTINSLGKYSRFPIGKNKWNAMKLAIKDASVEVSKYKAHELVGMSRFSSSLLDDTVNKIQSIRGSAQSYAAKAYVSYGIANGDDFFNKYPVSLNKRAIIQSTASKISSILNSSSLEDTNSFVSAYGGYLSSRQKKSLGNLYLSQYVKESSDKSKPVLSIVMSALVEAKKVGLSPDSTGDMKIKFVEITSKTLLKEGQVEFPAEINMDLPFEIGKSQIKDIFSDNSGADYIIVFDVALANVNRRIQKRNKEKSILLAGHNTIHNPNFMARQMDVQNAQTSVQSANSQYCSPGAYSWGCELGKAISVGIAQETLRERQQLLLSTPQTLKEPIHEEYEYSTSNMDVKKSLTAHFYVVNVKDKTYYKDTFDVSENKAFTISYDVNPKDINKSTLASKYDSEEDISSYEDKAIDVNVSMLLAHYLKNLGDEVKLKSEDELRMTMMYDKNQALTAYKERTYDARALNDPRFDHVVVIYNPTGSMGSGFYVTPDLVLTNYHVIEGAKYAEMKLYNGHETFGKVVKSDVRLDLALVKVQEKGKPVQFYDKNKLDLGSTTEAIGHPKGLEFTITRGVISAVRKRESVFDTGGKKVLFVQTDTPINPGNSGGPLFLGNKVVGVNDNKLVGMDTEGISFSIHHSEVEKFLKEDF